MIELKCFSFSVHKLTIYPVSAYACCLNVCNYLIIKTQALNTHVVKIFGLLPMNRLTIGLRNMIKET